MSFIPVLLSALQEIYAQWSAANDADKAQIEAACVAAVNSMVAASQSTATAHAARTAATEAAIAADAAALAAPAPAPTAADDTPTNPGTVGAGK